MFKNCLVLIFMFVLSLKKKRNKNFFYYNGNLLAFVDAFNNTHCHNKLNTQVEHQKYNGS